MELFGNTRTIRVAAVVDLAAHTAADIVAVLALGALGGRAGAGRLRNVAVTDRVNQKAPLTLHFFAGTLGSGTYALNGPFTPSDADMALYLGKVEIAAGDYATVGTKALGSKECNIVLRSSTPDAADGVLTCVVVTTGTPDYVAADDLRFAFGIAAD